MPAKLCSSSTVVDDVLSTRSKLGTRSMPSFSPSSQIGEQFTTWFAGSGGGYKKDRPPQQIVNRCLKFLKFCCTGEEELYFEVKDFSLCSPSLLFKFIDYLQEECKVLLCDSDRYKHFVRPLLKPQCDFVLVTKMDANVANWATR